MRQEEYIRIICLTNPDAVIIGSIGTISYDLTKIPHKKKILIRGAMGAALGCGLGYAMGRPDKKVIVIIGEGALLMHMGSVATILKHNLPNLKVIVINNGCYISCGGQKNDFDAVESLIKSQKHIFEIFKPLLTSALPV